MLVKVLKKFRDKNNNKLLLPGMEIEVTKERYKEIQSKGKYLCDVAQEPEEQEEKAIDLTQMTLDQLKEFAKLNKIDTSGAQKKADYIEKIVAANQ